MTPCGSDGEPDFSPEEAPKDAEGSPAGLALSPIAGGDGGMIFEAESGAGGA